MTSSKIKRVTIIVLDSAGVGYLPDAGDFGDIGANTLGNTSRYCGGLQLPNLQRLGLGNLTKIHGVEPATEALGGFGKAQQASKGKDTTTGHWEIAGLIIENSFPTYPDGFPRQVIDLFERQTGRKVMGNKPASGTEIIKELGEEQLKNGAWIVYTSADSVFQVAAHEEKIPLHELYEACELALKICTEYAPAARVIARPFTGSNKADFARTFNRHDFALTPPAPTILDKLKIAGLEVIGVGKIKDIFANQGITKSMGNNRDNLDGIKKTIIALEKDTRGLIFTNLVDFDMLFGHRRNPSGYHMAMMEFDDYLPEIMENLKEEEVLIITADHGCDPTFKGTDHTREYIPILVYGKHIRKNINLGIRSTFADIAATLEELLLGKKTQGSFAKEIRK